MLRYKNSLLERILLEKGKSLHAQQEHTVDSEQESMYKANYGSRVAHTWVLSDLVVWLVSLCLCRRLCSTASNLLDKDRPWHLHQFKL